MHAGPVLVALHLMGLDVTEVRAGWQDLEALVALDESVTSAGLFLLSTIRAWDFLSSGAYYSVNLYGTLPTALCGGDLPRTTGPVHSALVLEGRLRPRCVGGKYHVTVPHEVPCNMMGRGNAPFGDNAGHRRISQCKFQFAITVRAAAVDVVEELEKAGLLKLTDVHAAALQHPPAPAATTQSARATTAGRRGKLSADTRDPAATRDAEAAAKKAAAKAAAEHKAAATAFNKAQTKRLQQAFLDALARQWARYEEFRGKTLPRTAASFARGQSTLGERHLYPLSLLLPVEPTRPVPSALRVDTGDDTLEDAPTEAAGFPPGAAAAMAPRRSPPTPPARHTAARMAVTHTAWCEFRLVVSDLRQVGISDEHEASGVLAVFERPAKCAGAWALVYSSMKKDGVAEQIRSRLREDMRLSLVVVTVTHVCVPAALNGLPPPTAAQGGEGSAAAKRTRAEQTIEKAEAPSKK
jgi:hypothetical protein